MALPKRFPEREEISAVRAEAEKAEPGDSLDQEHRVAGRVMARREMGKLTFLDLVDRSGRIQLITAEKVDLDLGDIVGVTGKPGRSRRGEPSLTVTSLELLAKIRRPLPDTFHGVTDVETRYRQRYLDLLMSEQSRALALLEGRDAVLEQHLLVLRVVVFRVLRDVAELTRDADAVGNLAALVVRQVLDLLLQLLVAFWSEDYVLQRAS